MIRKTLAFAASAAVAALSFAAPATAGDSTPAQDCKTSTTHLVNRPDSGNHGDWAVDTITRTVTICTAHQDDGAAVAAVPYHATVVDDGTFVTTAGSSPQAGVPLAAGATGTVHGSFTADFTAQPGFVCFNNTFGGDTYHDAAPAATSDWVRKDWDGKCQPSDFTGTSINQDWSWTYTTCAEKWTDAATNQDGELPADGDITGKVCPSPSPKLSVSPSTPGRGGSTHPATSTTPVASLPVTGAPTGYLIGGALVLVGLGGGLVLLGRRRKAESR